MPKPIRKRQPHQYADRFYDYLIDHRSEVLRYITVALVTALIQFVLERVIPAEGGAVLFPQVIRFLIFFYALKFWAYREGGTGFFYTARQMMIAVMTVTVVTWLTYQLIILFERLIGGGALITYIGKAILEIVYFVLYQFLIFKKQKD